MSPRVLLVTKGLDLGGTERIVVDLASGLREAGAAVEVALVNPRRRALVPTLHDVPVRELGGTDTVGPGAARRLARLVAADDHDVVHVHGPLPAVVARLTPRRRPVVTSFHTPWYALRRPTRMAVRATAGLDRASVAVSAAVQASMPRAIARRMVVIPHGIDERAVRAAAGNRSARADGGISVIAVASHRDAKNYPNLLQAVRHARLTGAPVRLLAVGDGPGLQRHRQMTRELGLDDIVEFRPAEADVMGLIAGADLLVVASDYEGQPLVVSEALALGVPVVATAVGRVPELVRPDVGLVVPTRDPSALGAAIAELALDSSRREGMRDAALALGPGRTLDDVVNDHLALYRRVLAS
jgi:glycosyltransferase involved in cell wall biosynthesis